MASDLTLTMNLSGQGAVKGTAGLGTPTENVVVGQGNFGAMQVGFSFGTGNNQANKWFAAQRTVGAGANDDLDLAGGLTNGIGEVLTFTKVKYLLIALVAPDGTRVLRVGPQGVANAFQGPHGGVVAGNYVEVKNFSEYINEPITGYTVTAGTGDVLRVNNPGGGSVTYNILIIGV
jgi:hypothetical protein